MVLNTANREVVTLSDKQKVVFNWLYNELQLPAYADVYKGACDLLNRQSRGYIVFVCHAGRELMNGLVPTVIRKDRRTAQYANFFDGLEKHWKDEWGAVGLNKRDRIINDHLIPHKICKKIKDMIGEHKAGRLRPREVAALFFTTFLGYDDNGNIPSDLIQKWMETRDWFFDFTHLGDDDLSEDPSVEVLQQFQTLDDLLHIAATSAFGRMRIINEILDETNKRNDRPCSGIGQEAS